MTLVFLVGLSAAQIRLFDEAAYEAPKQNHEIQPPFVLKSQEFSAKFFEVTMKEKDWKTIVTSPLAVEFPLGQIMLGSCGPSAAEIAQTLGLTNNIVTQLFPCVLRKIEGIQGIELGIASKIYAVSGLPIKQAYQQKCLDIFSSQVETFDPRLPLRSLKIINDWVESQTNRRIKGFVKDNDFLNDTKLFLVNAAFFNGIWSIRFDRRATKYRKFHLNDVQTERVSTMFIIGSYLYYNSQTFDAKVLRMEFKNCVCSMIIFLPNSKTGVPALVMKLQDVKYLNTVLAKMQKNIVQVYMPKFKIISDYDLTHILPKIGISKIFDSVTANMSNMIVRRKDICVGKARQKVFFKISEDGSEANTGNEFQTMITIANRSDVKLFRANRPFIFQIRIEEFILFQGSFMG